MTPRNRRPNKKKPSRATRDATDALFRPLQFPTRASWEAYLEQRAKEREELERRAQEREELRARGVPEEEARLIADETDPRHDR